MQKIRYMTCDFDRYSYLSNNAGNTVSYVGYTVDYENTSI